MICADVVSGTVSVSANTQSCDIGIASELQMSEIIKKSLAEERVLVWNLKVVALTQYENVELHFAKAPPGNIGRTRTLISGGTMEKHLCRGIPAWAPLRPNNQSLFPSVKKIDVSKKEFLLR